MKVSNYMARQFASPTGLFGRLVIGNMLNRANIKSNNLVLKMLNLKPESHVLEAGFGGGDLLLKISQTVTTGRLDGIEMSAAMLQALERKLTRNKAQSNIHLHRGTIESLPFEDNLFDRACSVNTIYFWSDLSRGLLEFSRVIQSYSELSGPADILCLVLVLTKHCEKQVTKGAPLPAFSSINAAHRLLGFQKNRDGGKRAD